MPVRQQRALVICGTDQICAEMIRGVAASLIPAGWAVSYHSEPLSGPTPVETVRECDAVVAAGLIYPETRRLVRECPFVIGMREDFTSDGYPSVVVDDDLTGQQAAEHLIGNGLRQFTSLALGDVGFSRQRIHAFRLAILAAGLQWACDPPLFRGEMQHIEHWLAKLPAPIGIFTPCDEWGRLLIDWAHRYGYRVPEQIQVVSADNCALACDVATTSMSSVNIPWRELGRRAGELLLESIRHRPAAVPLIRIAPAGVIVRRSSDLLHVDDAMVALALKVIRESADRHIDVPYVLRHVPTSRRELEKSFRRLVGRSIMQEVRRVHVQLARQLLALTDLDMPQIAKRSGFPSAEKLSVNFRKATSLAPSAYRKQVRMGEPQLRP